MRTYLCICGQPVFFNNSVCISCGRAVGFDPFSKEMRELDMTGEDGVLQLAQAETPKKRGLFRRTPKVPEPPRYRFCANLHVCGCNWLIPADAAPETLCPGCMTTRVIPDLSLPGNPERWNRLETAKRRLLFTLLDLGLWGPGAKLQTTLPLVFDFLQNLPGQQVLTGHENGVVTLNVQEADDDHREKTRLELREPYRSLLGHFRHESGHFYWEVLIKGTHHLDEYRALFGDETADYATALQRNYTEGPPLGWDQNHISAYASSHPWEDWAETWAHWLHMHDTLETAEAAQCRTNIVRPKIDPALLCEPGQKPEAEHQAFCERISHWVALTTLVNELTRSMGQPDAYPFASGGAVLKKLFFIERVVRGV
ncbi:zinc-binding metallopeptidase family protein [Prosthecobacter fusiformis]|nr:putative zinc-binding metallopeptidase [Prosthecobacter fusiformis]